MATEQELDELNYYRNIPFVPPTKELPLPRHGRIKVGYLKLLLESGNSVDSDLIERLEILPYLCNRNELYPHGKQSDHDKYMNGLGFGDIKTEKPDIKRAIRTLNPEEEIVELNSKVDKLIFLLEQRNKGSWFKKLINKIFN
mgnify:CR=1 FL=1